MKRVWLFGQVIALGFCGCSLLSGLKNSSVYESLENQTLFQTSSGDSEKMAAEKGRDEKTINMTKMDAGDVDTYDSTGAPMVNVGPDTLLVKIDHGLDLTDPTLNPRPLVLNPDSSATLIQGSENSFAVDTLKFKSASDSAVDTSLAQNPAVLDTVP